MEEILASIRRIIADDDASKSAQRAAETSMAVSRAAAPTPAAFSVPPAAPPEPSLAEGRDEMQAADDPAVTPDADLEEQASDILDLTDAMAVSPPVPSAPAAPNATSGPGPQFRRIEGHSDVSFDDASENSPKQSAGEGARRQAVREADDRGADARGQLMSSDTRAAVDSAFNTLAQTVLVQNARTLEDLVREMLRPMLKAWIDDNLPSMVERLVRDEIERVSRGRAG